MDKTSEYHKKNKNEQNGITRKLREKKRKATSYWREQCSG
jgi:hypothetical protein